MDILWLMMKMVVYGLMVGLIIGIGAFCYAFISIHFAERTGLKEGERSGHFTLWPTHLSKSRR